MKISATTACLALLFSFGCKPRATQADCQKACERVAELRLAPEKKINQMKLHELDEKVESIEDESKDRLETLRKELAAPPPQPDAKALRKLSAKARKGLAERQAWEANQLRIQRELAIKNEDASLADAKKVYEETKARLKEEEQKATAESVASCLPACAKKSASEAACLQRTQAVEDIDLCGGL